MSAKAYQTTIDRLGIEEGDKISSGRTDVWTVERVKNSRIVECNLVVQSHEGDWSNLDPEQVTECECGQYTLDNRTCFDCYQNQEGE